MIVYADILVFLNSLITYFLLISVCAFFKSRPKTIRLILGAIAGGISALIIFLPDLGFLFEFVLRAIICTIITFITFSFKNYIRFLKYCLSFLAVSYIFAGGMLALFSIFNPKPMVYANGITYFDISPVILIISSALIYLALRLALLFKKEVKSEELIFDCIIEYSEKAVTFQAVNDTGNSLCDPYFGSPVAIIEKSILKPILESKPKTYLIPVKSVINCGVLYAFRPSAFYIVKNGKKHKTENITVAVCEEKVHKQFNGILSPKIIQDTEEQLCLELQR